MAQTSFFHASLKKPHSTSNSPPLGEAASPNNFGYSFVSQGQGVSSFDVTARTTTDLTYFSDEANLPHILEHGFPSGAQSIEVELSPTGQEPNANAPSTPKFSDMGFDAESDNSTAIGRVMGKLRKKTAD